MFEIDRRDVLRRGAAIAAAGAVIVPSPVVAKGAFGPAELGEIVVGAIERNEPYIFPHGEFREEVAAYFDEMRRAFPTEFEIDERRRASEERRARMTAEAKALADALGREGA